MNFDHTRKGMEYLLWIGNNSIYIWNKKENKEERIDLTLSEKIPYVPKFHAVWEETYYCDKLNRAFGGTPWIHRKRIIMAVPDDITWIEKRALIEFAIRAGAGKKLTLYPQSLLLNPLAERYIAVTWSCRCLSICLIKDGIAEKKDWLAISSTWEDFISKIGSIGFYDDVPTFYPQIEPPPFLFKIGTGLSLEKLAGNASILSNHSQKGFLP